MMICINFQFIGNQAGRWNFVKLIKFIFHVFVSLISSIFVLGRRVFGISRSQIWSKTLMELIFNLCGEFQWSPEGPVSQIHSPDLHVGASGIFSDLLRSVQMLNREWGAESYRTYPSLVKLQPGFLSLQRKPAFEQNCGLGSWICRWRTCPWSEYSDDITVFPTEN